MSRLRDRAWPCLLLLLAGCDHRQSALAPYGTDADARLRLFWLFLAISVVVWVLVMMALAWALLRRRRAWAIGRPNPLAPVGGDRTALTIVSAAVGLTALVLVGLTAVSYATSRSLAGLRGREALQIRITGHQWWWEVQYEDPDVSRIFTTANEIHVPVGVPVKLELQADDVIHSFWVPSLAGKEDLIPGHQNTLDIVATRPGIYRGQCAEFCGWQHAHMAVLVVADPPDAFDKWREGQIRAATEPIDIEARRGRQVFLSRGCMMCHAIRGTGAGGRTGPDLTHVASRTTLAAGTLAMTRGSLGAWIADPQTIKPGANMPRVNLDPNELNAVVAYLAGLK